MNPMLSIIIPFYGSADVRLLDRCIDSIKKQELPTDSYEIIVANDNGKEVGGARNNGIALAKGEYLLFVDADDYLFENSLLPLFEMLMREQPDILTFDYRRVANNESLHLIQKTGEEIYQTGALYMCRHNFLGTEIGRASCRERVYVLV